MRLILPLLIIGACLALVGCGQKGPLSMPDKTQLSGQYSGR